MTRPNPLLWIWYTLGGRPGSAYREWVLHDTTCRTRWVRQIVRVVVQVVLSAAVVLAVVGVTWIVWAAVGLGLLLALWYFPGLHQLDRGAAPREAWVRAGDTDAGAARARSPRARRSDRSIQADLSEGCRVAQSNSSSDGISCTGDVGHVASCPSATSNPVHGTTPRRARAIGRPYRRQGRALPRYAAKAENRPTSGNTRSPATSGYALTLATCRHSPIRATWDCCCEGTPQAWLWARRRSARRPVAGRWLVPLPLSSAVLSTAVHSAQPTLTVRRQSLSRQPRPPRPL